MASRHRLRERFTSFWTDSAEHHGKTFTITGMVWVNTEDDGLDNPEPRFDIVFADGTSFDDANAEELFEGWASPERPTAESAPSTVSAEAR